MVGQIQRTRGKAAYRRAADAAGKKPVNSVLPAISGNPVVGQTLSCSTGTWSNTPDAYAYQWNRSGAGIAGAAGDQYVLVQADVGATISCTVKATNLGVTAAATSISTAEVQAA